MQTLKEHIESQFSGSQVDFAASQQIPTTKQEVYRWIKNGSFFVVKNKLIQVKRVL